MWKAPSPVPGGCSCMKVNVFSRAGHGASAQLSGLLCISGFLRPSLRFCFNQSSCSGAEPCLQGPVGRLARVPPHSPPPAPSPPSKEVPGVLAEVPVRALT